MILSEAIIELALLQKKMHAFNHATSMIYFDSVTVAPEDTAVLVLTRQYEEISKIPQGMS